MQKVLFVKYSFLFHCRDLTHVTGSSGNNVERRGRTCEGTGTEDEDHTEGERGDSCLISFKSLSKLKI